MNKQYPSLSFFLSLCLSDPKISLELTLNTWYIFNVCQTINNSSREIGIENIITLGLVGRLNTGFNQCRNLPPWMPFNNSLCPLNEPKRINFFFVLLD